MPSAGPASARPVTPAGAAPWGRERMPSWERRPWRVLVALLVAIGTLSLLLALLAPALRFSEDTTEVVRRQAMVVVPSCLVILFVLLHGLGTSCPACGRPWAREEGETECLGREEFHKDGETRVRAKRRTNYTCKHCQHAWSATYTDEYKGTLHRRGAAEK